MLRASPVRSALCLMLVLAALMVDFDPSMSPPAVAREAAPLPEFVPHELIVGFEPGTPEAEREMVVARRGGRIVRHLVGVDAALVTLTMLRPLGEVAAAL